MSLSDQDNRPVGIFDSGMGGISVLGEAIQQMPNESFVYYGDSANAPYGEKSTAQIIALSERVCEVLLAHDVKAIVIACNTATSAAASHLRKKFTQIPILGMEPALKPAVQDFPKGTIVVMATEVTLREKKFAELMLKTASKAKVIKLPCPSLVRMVERSVVYGPEAEKELKACYDNIDLSSIDGVVLGCTHFLFLRKALKGLLGEGVHIYDGNGGTINNLKAILLQKGQLAQPNHQGSFILKSSKDEAYNQQMLDLLRIYEEVAL
ncbi:glutamate racemase [Acidaminobacter hydrogenoformans]|uniref:Glutamate racemase n=1 Tax=Acidaminobacter hydrogenoformans DSM 2784 TaxID=1120920 RepID=A0A1G5RZ76_9FIRM|nr:glutamate racemase [Acidaminobacter hydrogenoformans]SCZ79237.1 glutamate racemase [Acidaminobacter hydrogenoformans DSM 2784]